MDLQNHAFTAGRFEVSFHLLAAALHLAEEMDSLERLGTIAGLCSERLMPTENADQFARLATIAKATIGRIDIGQLLKENRALWGGC